jgi:arsenate reductase
MIHQSFSDPGHTALADRPGEDLATSFRRVQHEIKEYIREFINQNLPV